MILKRRKTTIPTVHCSSLLFSFAVHSTLFFLFSCRLFVCLMDSEATEFWPFSFFNFSIQLLRVSWFWKLATQLFFKKKKELTIIKKKSWIISKAVKHRGASFFFFFNLHRLSSFCFSFPLFSLEQFFFVVVVVAIVFLCLRPLSPALRSS